MNQQIWKLWSAHPREAGAYVPKFVMPANKEDIVFLGLNPSLPKKRGLKQIQDWIQNSANTKILGLLGMDPNSKWYPECFLWELSGLDKRYSEEIAEAYAKIHHGAREFYGKKWFKRLNEIKEEANIKNYGHVDLFFCLHASFRCLPPEYHAPANHVHSSQPNFVQKQLELAYEILRKHEPKLIIAVYKSAAEIFLRYHASICRHQPNDLSPHCLLDGKLVERIDLCFDGHSVPFLICSNLPGHRSLKEEDAMVKTIVSEIEKMRSTHEGTIQCQPAQRHSRADRHRGGELCQGAEEAPEAQRPQHP